MTEGQNPSDIRAQNLRLLLALLVRHRQVTRVQLARATGLSKTSITNLVNECLQQGLIVETAETLRAHGRPAKYIRLSSEAPQVIGVSISRLHMTFTLARLDGEILSLHRQAIDAYLSYETMLERIRTGIAALMETAPGAVVGIGISMLGPVEPREGLLLAPQNFMQRPTVYPIAAPLRAWAGMPVQVMHDVAAAVLAERLFNPGRREANFGFLSLHAGVGLGLCLNDELYQGSGGFSGELGHLSIHADGIPCACGQRGCLERYANLESMRERQHALEALFPASPLAGQTDVAFADFVQTAAAGDPLAAIVVNDYLDLIATALVSVMNVLSLDLILVDYAGMEETDYLERQLEAKIAVRHRHRHDTGSPVSVRPSQFGHRIAAMSSVAIVVDQVLGGELPLIAGTTAGRGG